jgi:GTP cyclohydrolase II
LRQEGRGIGLGNKIRAYALQDNGRDTVEANHELGFPADARSYDVAAAILTELNVSSVKLLSNNPAKREALQGLGIDVVERVPLVIDAQVHNHHYLQTKADRMGHNYKSDDG